MFDYKKTIYTKKKLRYAFSIIIFFIVFILLSLYTVLLYIMYYYEYSKMFSSIAQSIEKNKISIDFIRDIGKNMNQDYKNLNLNLSYIVLKNSEIVESYYSYNFTKDEINYIINYNKNDVFKYNNYISKLIYINGKKIYLIDQSPYTTEEILFNIFTFFIISILGSGIFYIFLGKYINNLFKPVEENISNMNDFIHNAGHELQTPLSVIVSDIDFYTSNDKKDDYILMEIKNETKKMGELIKSLLRISKNDYIINIESFNVFNFINDILTIFEDKINKKKIKIIIDITENINTKANSEHLTICINNIILNAIKYNKERGVIKISFINNCFIIEDSGIGIEKENLDKIFDRFYKEDKSRNSEGFGIGLSLVKKLADLNGWKIQVKSEKGVGSSFFIFI